MWVHVYIYIYIYIHIYIHMHIYTHMCVYIYLSVCMYTETEEEEAVAYLACTSHRALSKFLCLFVGDVGDAFDWDARAFLCAHIWDRNGAR